jgi:RNA polymerase sigma factor
MFQLLTTLQDVLAEDGPIPESPSMLGHLEDSIRRVQAGDQDLRNQVITDCLPYIKGVLHRMLPIPLIEQADEYSIALAAFNESIDRYRWETRVPFLRFAGLVINRRIIDWIRQQRKHQQVQPFSRFTNDEGESMVDSLVSCPPDEIWQNMEIEEEIVSLTRRMQEYNLALARLAKTFPKHRDSRQSCLRAARLLLGDPDLRGRFEDDHRLPAAELARRSMMPLKTIENNRQSIIFLALLLSSDLEVIKAYLLAYSKEDAL